MKNSKKKEYKNRLLLVIIFLSSLLLIVATYAWFSVALNVKLDFLIWLCKSDSGLFISLDAVNYSDSVEVSFNSVLRDINVNYPSHTNQWASGGFGQFLLMVLKTHIKQVCCIFMVKCA